MTNFGEIARNRRFELGLSQYKVSDMACCDRRTLRAFEFNQRDVGIDIVQNILSAVGLRLVIEEIKDER